MDRGGAAPISQPPDCPSSRRLPCFRTGTRRPSNGSGITTPSSQTSPLFCAPEAPWSRSAAALGILSGPMPRHGRQASTLIRHTSPRLQIRGSGFTPPGSSMPPPSIPRRPFTLKPGATTDALADRQCQGSSDAYRRVTAAENGAGVDKFTGEWQVSGVGVTRVRLGSTTRSLGCLPRPSVSNVPHSDITVRLGATLQQDIDSGTITAAPPSKRSWRAFLQCPQRTSKP